MIIFMYRRLKTTETAKISKFQIKVSIQTLVIAGLADAVTMGYLAASYLPLSPGIVEYTGVFGEMLWIALHGGTGIIYLLMNNAVNGKFKSIFCGAVAVPLSEATHTEAVTQKARSNAVVQLPPVRTN
ncbi:hypothetical protein L596_012889 [Steinernema carpocapsae]|uniref:7TM GPCR serpentine receptor class x (Srx) domain-containing protein n=1 Tax=Steinernema carpocapsae TaxID=34508 RepID=A0A4U5NZB0_STECR|nr:hypothetical protein L596_012889 [Steinernema carpocapsae]